MKIAFPLLITALALAAFASGAWVSETVSSTGDVGSGCAMATDPWNRPCVAYADKTNNRVMYAGYTGSQWVFETAASGVELQGETSLAINATGAPALIFGDITSEEVKYAYKSGSTWTVETVAEGRGTGRLVTLALAPTGPVALYSVEVGTSPVISYAYREGGVWTTESARSNAVAGALCLDTAGAPHMVFQDVAATSIRHTMRSGTTWSTPIIIGSGIDCDVVFGPDYGFHVCYCKPNNDGLVYAKSSDGNIWFTEDVPVGSAKPAYSHIAVTTAGDIFISYFDFATYNLRAAKRLNGVWSDEEVTAGEYAGNSNAITANGLSGHPYIAYYDNRPADMKVAHYNLTNITLGSFTARYQRGGIDLAWAADGLVGVAGFNLYRAEKEPAGKTKAALINDDLITGRSPYRYVDADVKAGLTYQYWLEAVLPSGRSERFGPAECAAGALPHAFALNQNYPNPARGETTVVFSLPAAGGATLALYDLAGRKIATPFSGRAAAGENEVALELSALAPGVYTYRLETADYAAARKMVVMP